MLRRFSKDKTAASEIVGTALFLVILFFFFTNVFLWHDQVTRDIDQVISDKKNTAVSIEAFSNTTNVWVKINNIGGLDVTLSRLWILTNDTHYFAHLDPHNIHVAAGRHMNITFANVTRYSPMKALGLRVNGSVLVYYEQPLGKTVTYRVITRLDNSADCSLNR